MRKLIESCPGCGKDLAVTRLTCLECGVEVTGRFAPSLFDHLSPESLAFAETFMRLRGNIREMERELGVPYSTVRGRLDEVIREMGFDAAGQDEPGVSADEDSGSEPPLAETRQEILERLDRGEISADEAADLLASAR